MRGEGIFAEQISKMFDVARRKAGIPDDGLDVFNRELSSAGRGAARIGVLANTPILENRQPAEEILGWTKRVVAPRPRDGFIDVHI